MSKHKSKNRGSSNPKSRFQESDIHAIRRDLARGIPPAVLARKYSVAPSSISNIKTGRTWSHLTPRGDEGDYR